MHTAEYMFVRDYHAVNTANEWKGPKGAAVLDLLPILVGDVPVSRNTSILRWLVRSGAVDVIRQHANADAERYALTIETCGVVAALFK